MTTTPSADAAPTDMTAMRAAIETGRTTSAALVERAIERAEAVNPQLNFIAWPTFERARKQAAEPRPGPPGGVPKMIKDPLHTEDHRVGKECHGQGRSWGAAYN